MQLYFQCNIILEYSKLILKGKSTTVTTSSITQMAPNFCMSKPAYLG